MGCPIQKSQDHSLVAGSPELIAGSRVFHRLLTPRHPPYALSNLITPTSDRFIQTHFQLTKITFAISIHLPCIACIHPRSVRRLLFFFEMRLLQQTACRKTDSPPKKATQELAFCLGLTLLLQCNFPLIHLSKNTRAKPRLRVTQRRVVSRTI